MVERLVCELREQIAEIDKQEIKGQVQKIIASGISPLALQIALQLPTKTTLALTILRLI